MTPVQSLIIDANMENIIRSLGIINPNTLSKEEYINNCYPSVECFFTNSSKREIESMCSYVLWKHKKKFKLFL